MLQYLTYQVRQSMNIKSTVEVVDDDNVVLIRQFEINPDYLVKVLQLNESVLIDMITHSCAYPKTHVPEQVGRANDARKLFCNYFNSILHLMVHHFRILRFLIEGSNPGQDYRHTRIYVAGTEFRDHNGKVMRYIFQDELRRYIFLKWYLKFTKDVDASVLIYQRAIAIFHWHAQL